MEQKAFRPIGKYMWQCREVKPLGLLGYVGQLQRVYMGSKSQTLKGHV